MIARRKITASLFALVMGATLALAPAAQAQTPQCPVWSENNVWWHTYHQVSIHVTCLGGQAMRASLQSVQGGGPIRQTVGAWRSAMLTNSVANRPGTGWTPVGSTVQRLL